MNHHDASVKLTRSLLVVSIGIPLSAAAYLAGAAAVAGLLIWLTLLACGRLFLALLFMAAAEARASGALEGWDRTSANFVPTAKRYSVMTARAMFRLR